MPRPTPELIARSNVKQPSDLDRTTSREMCVKCLAECDVEVIQAACFREPHANGEFHLNLLVRAGKQWKWKKPAERFVQVYKVHVNFAENIRTWAEGVT